jgi:hypothetical protein
MNKRIIITSEMRCGSRWLHYWLADLFEMRTSPEIDVSKIEQKQDLIREHFEAGRIVKFHHALPEQILEILKPVDYTVVGVVRNPRDQGVSRAFHRRYDRSGNPKMYVSDADAIKRYFASENFRRYSENMLDMMWDYYSTRNHCKDSHYVWTSYEWMKQDIISEVTAISKVIGFNPQVNTLKFLKRKHSFKNKSGREPGAEVRNDRWRRKGIIGDWVNWLSLEEVKSTEYLQNKYWEKLFRQEI